MKKKNTLNTWVQLYSFIPNSVYVYSHEVEQ